MKKNQLHFDENTYKILLYQYKEYLISLAIICVAGMLFFFLIIPQFKEYGEMREEEKKIQKRIQVIQDNRVFISKLDATTLDSEFQTASRALPIEKDFAGILNTIAQTSERSGVSVNDFVFSVGEVSTPSARSNTRAFLQVDMTLKGGITDAKKFLDMLTRSLPVSEVLSIRVSNGAIGIKKVYYYKQYAPLPYSDDLVLRAISEKQANVLREVSSWE